MVAGSHTSGGGVYSVQFLSLDRQQLIDERGEGLKFLRRAPHYVSIATLLWAFDACALAQAQSSASDSADAQRSRDNQPAAEPTINVTVTSPNPSAEDVKRDEERQQRQIVANEDIRDLTRMLAILAAVQALITGFALLYTARAANAAKQSADTARDALHLSHRAYLNLAEIALSEFGGTRFPDVLIQIRNSGRLAATVTDWCTVCVIGQELQVPRPTEFEWIKMSAVAAPDNTVTMTYPPTASIGNPNAVDWKNFANGLLSLKIYGAIRYDAGFGLKGEVGFAMFYNPYLTRLETHRRFATEDVPGYNYSR